MATIPKITQQFMQKIAEQAHSGTYRINLGKIPIDVFPYVFPPQSPFSESTHTVYDDFGNLAGKKVLDIGTGTGIQAIKSALAGSSYVEAVDILPDAVECARHNVKLNRLEDRICVFDSDLFAKVTGRFDLIIANLPILDFDEKDVRFHSLSDPKFKYHEQLFSEASNYLNPQARIVMCHADLQEDGFQKLELLAQAKGFKYNVTKSTTSLGYNWRNYEFFQENKK